MSTWAVLMDMAVCQSGGNFGFANSQTLPLQAIQIPLIVRQMSLGWNIEDSALELKHRSNQQLDLFCDFSF